VPSLAAADWATSRVRNKLIQPALFSVANATDTRAALKGTHLPGRALDDVARPALLTNRWQ